MCNGSHSITHYIAYLETSVTKVSVYGFINTCLPHKSIITADFPFLHSLVICWYSGVIFVSVQMNDAKKDLDLSDRFGQNMICGG